MKGKYSATIGLEIHAELSTASKMFCSCANDPFNSAPNTNVCPICLGFPGTLPVPNKRAVESTLQVGEAFKAKRAKLSKFDRKNYFYPDLPKGYQVSQYDLPLMVGGSMMVEGKQIFIRRVHLEEDTGKLLHKEAEAASLVDYNRAGVPLIELVTEPAIASAREASAFARELQLILRHLGASRADMEKGELRVEANVSVRKVGSKTFGTKVELKNLNSFYSLERAIAFEIERQIDILDNRGHVIQETRGWDQEQGKTFSQRTKEEAEDYRYFPEPDIPPLNVATWEVVAGELPEDRRRAFTEMGLTEHDARVLVSDHKLADFFKEVVATSQLEAKKVANWIINEGIRIEWGVESVADLLGRVIKGELTAPRAKEIIKSAKETGRLEVPTETARVAASEIAKIVDEVLIEHQAAAVDYKAGKKEAFGYLIGQVMAKSRGQADPKLINELLKEKLGG